MISFISSHSRASHLLGDVSTWDGGEGERLWISADDISVIAAYASEGQASASLVTLDNSDLHPLALT